MTMLAQLKAADIAQIVNGSLEGKADGDLLIEGIADLKSAGPHQLSFVAKAAYAQFLASSQAGLVIVGKNIEITDDINALRVDDAYLAYALISEHFVKRQSTPGGIHPSAIVDPSAVLGEGVKVGPNCVIEAGAQIGANTELQAQVFVGQDTVVGANSLLYAGVCLYHGVSLGEHCVVHSNTVIGSDGFGFAPSSAGWQKIHQLGGVVIGNKVEIGANTAIDRGALSDTQIGDGVIIDNQVHIAHNVVIGDHTAIAGCVGIAGSAEVGARCTMGGFVAINGHIKITDDVHLHGGTIVTKSIDEAGTYASCTPMQDVKKWRKNSVRYIQLDDWVSRIKKLEKNSGE